MAKNQPSPHPTAEEAAATLNLPLYRIYQLARHNVLRVTGTRHLLQPGLNPKVYNPADVARVAVILARCPNHRFGHTYSCRDCTKEPKPK